MEFVVDWNAVCLVCLQEGEMRSIYDKDENDFTYCDKIMRCSNIEIKRGMNLPEQICTTCVDDLSAAFRFRTNCESSNVILKSFIDSRITDLEIPAGNGQIYKYKPPSGLNVKRIKCAPKFEEIKEEEMVEENLDSPSENDTGEDCGIIESDLQGDDDSNQPLSTLKSPSRPSKTLKLVESVDPVEDDITDEVSSIQEHKTESAKKGTKTETETNSVNKKKAGKRGRPKTRVQKPKFDTEVTPENISAMVSHLSSVAYVRKLPEDEKPLKICEICGNGYKYQHALDSHMRRHRNEKPFSCEFCERAFVANVELRRHMRVHTGQKPYPCRFCDRRFSDFGSRIKHERTHTGERPYVCVTCGKAFAYAHVLSVHALTHTGEKRFKCAVCGKGFTKKIYLQSHMLNHRSTQDSTLSQQIEIIERIDDQQMVLKSEPDNDIMS